MLLPPVSPQVFAKSPGGIPNQYLGPILAYGRMVGVNIYGDGMFPLFVLPVSV